MDLNSRPEEWLEFTFYLSTAGDSITQRPDAGLAQPKNWVAIRPSTFKEKRFPPPPSVGHESPSFNHAKPQLSHPPDSVGFRGGRRCRGTGKGPLTPQQQLVYAAFDLDVEKVKELIARPIDVDARMGNHPKYLFQDKWSLGWPVSSPKWTPLLAAAHSHRHPQPEKEATNSVEGLNAAAEARSKIDPKLIAERDSRRVEGLGKHSTHPFVPIRAPQAVRSRAAPTSKMTRIAMAR